VNFTFNNPLFTFILIFFIQMFVVNLLEYGEFVCKDRILNLLYTILLHSFSISIHTTGLHLRRLITTRLIFYVYFFFFADQECFLL
jgi:hypothetical protein